MAKLPLPPASRVPGDFYGPSVKSFGVCSWCKDQQSPVTAVAIHIELEDGAQLVLRLKTPERVDQLIEMLKRHKADVWPFAATQKEFDFDK